MSGKEDDSDDDFDFEGDDFEEPETAVVSRDVRTINWRRVELLNEQRMLKEQLLDMDDFQID